MLLQYLPAILTAVAGLLGVLFSWYGPHRLARIDRANRLRALYAAALRPILELNEFSRQLHLLLEANPSAEPKILPEAQAKLDTHLEAYNDVLVQLMIEPF